MKNGNRIINKAKRKHVSTPIYVSPKQLTLDGFESPFTRQSGYDNR
jgi:hypothetical protein